MKQAYGKPVSETSICNSCGYWLNPLTENTQPKLFSQRGKEKIHFWHLFPGNRIIIDGDTGFALALRDTLVSEFLKLAS
jgi:hypothetical protein